MLPRFWLWGKRNGANYCTIGFAQLGIEFQKSVSKSDLVAFTNLKLYIFIFKKLLRIPKSLNCSLYYLHSTLEINGLMLRQKADHKKNLDIFLAFS